jgi:hypothetical protein
MFYYGKEKLSAKFCKEFIEYFKLDNSLAYGLVTTVAFNETSV